VGGKVKKGSRENHAQMRGIHAYFVLYFIGPKFFLRKIEILCGQTHIPELARAVLKEKLSVAER
jgi:hypothetical protein